MAKKQKCLNLEPKTLHLSIFHQKSLIWLFFGKNFKKAIFKFEIQTFKFVNLQNFTKKTKMPEFCMKNAFFMYFSSGIWKQFCHIWNQSPWICLTGKYCEITKMLKFGTKIAFFGYLWVKILKDSCHIWNQHLRIIQFQTFVKKQKCLNLWPNMPYLSIFDEKCCLWEF